MKKEDARTIDICDWELSGGGAQGESYSYKHDKYQLLKLFPEGTDVNLIIREFEVSRSVKECGVPCTPPLDFVRSGDRYGMILQRLQNKKSFCRAMADDASCIPDIARRFALMGSKLHSMSSKGTPFISEVAYYQGLLDNNKTLSEDMGSRMQKALDIVTAEDTETLLHGDYHFGNVITNGVDDYFIDLGSFAYGNPKFDNSLLYLTCHITPEPMVMYYYHIDRKTALEFWEQYKKEYYSDNPSDKDLYEEYLPYLILRTLFFVEIVGQHKDVLEMMDSFAKDFDRIY